MTGLKQDQVTCADARAWTAHHLLRRWSSHRFPYGYLVTTSPQSWTTPW